MPEFVFAPEQQNGLKLHDFSMPYGIQIIPLKSTGLPIIKSRQRSASLRDKFAALFFWPGEVEILAEACNPVVNFSIKRSQIPKTDEPWDLQ